MKNKKLVFVFIFLLLNQVMYSVNVEKREIDSLFSVANNLYKSGRYSEAVELYTLILEKKYVSPELFYNLGNAYFKLSQFGLSRYHYEKALMYKPYDSDILHNINLLLETVPYEIGFGPPSEIEKITFLMIHSNLRFYLSILSFLCVGFALYYWIKNNFFTKVKYFVMKIVFLLSISIILIGIVHWIESNNKENYCVVVKDTIFIKSAPVETAKEIFVLNEVAKVMKLDEYQDYVKIRLPDGKVGWGRKSDFMFL